MNMTTANMQDEIQKAIKANLSAQVGDALQAELIDLADLRHEVPTLRTSLELEKTRCREWQDKVDHYRGELAKHKTLTERESAVTAREFTQQLRDLEVKLCEARRADALGLVHAIFKSPVYREFVSSTVPVAVEGAPSTQHTQGTPGSVQLHTSSTSKTVSQD